MCTALGLQLDGRDPGKGGGGRLSEQQGRAPGGAFGDVTLYLHQGRHLPGR